MPLKHLQIGVYKHLIFNSVSTLLVVGVISHQWCAAHLVGIAHHCFYSAISIYNVFFITFRDVTQQF